MGSNSDPSKKKRYCEKFNGSNFKFIQKSWTGEGFALCIVCRSDFSVAHEVENDIIRHKATKAPHNIDISMLHKNNKN